MAELDNLRRACDQWLRKCTLMTCLVNLNDFFDPSGPRPSDPDPEFDHLTQTLQRWAAAHGLGDGVELAEAAHAAYRRQFSDSAIGKAKALLLAITERSQQQAPALTALPTVTTRVDGVTPGAATPIQPSRNDRLDWNAVNQAIQEHLREHPDQDTAKQVAKAVGISTGSLAKADAWQHYQDEKNAKRSQSVHTRDLPFDPASRPSSETIDPRELIWDQIVQTATQHARGQLNGLKSTARDELIDYLMTSLDKFAGTPEERQEILKETVQSWLSDRGYPEEGWDHR